ncbi:MULTISPECIES: hypothetical protein [unclassified Cryobacterium]|nr:MULTISPECIES: hypothetical protein [unclassified Cryobacterium]
MTRTVLNAEQVDLVVDAGVSFVVSPGGRRQLDGHQGTDHG